MAYPGSVRTAALAAIAALWATSAAATTPQSVFGIETVRAVIEPGATVTWVNPDEDPTSAAQALLGGAAADGVRKVFNGARPAVFELRVQSFKPIAKGEAPMFGGAHELRAALVLLDGATGVEMVRESRNLDLWAVGFSGEKGPLARIDEWVETEVARWAQGLDCGDVACFGAPSTGVAAAPAQPAPEPEPASDSEAETVIVANPAPTETIEDEPAEIAPSNGQGTPELTATAVETALARRRATGVTMAPVVESGDPAQKPEPEVAAIEPEPEPEPPAPEPTVVVEEPAPEPELEPVVVEADPEPVVEPEPEPVQAAAVQVEEPEEPQDIAVTETEEAPAPEQQSSASGSSLLLAPTSNTGTTLVLPQTQPDPRPSYVVDLSGAISLDD